MFLGGLYFGGVVIDDLVLFERILMSDFEKISATSSLGRFGLESAIKEYQRVGLLPHPKKTVFEETKSEFWGCQFDGIAGTVQANLKRVIPVIAVTQRVLTMGVCTVGLLEVLVGSWTAISLFRRRLLSLLNVVYAASNGDFQRNHVLKLSDSLKEEMLLCLGLVPLAVTLLRIPNAGYLYSSDASEWGIGVTRAPLPEFLQKEVHRHKLKKSVWAKLLSPLRAFQRVKGTLPLDAELPDGHQLASHPLWIELATALPFTEVCRQRCRDNTHINVSELRGMLRAEKEAAMVQFPSRYFSLGDSQVALGVWTKGRSSSLALNQELQQSLGIHIGCGMFGNAGFVPSEFNSADDPTRGAEVRGPTKQLCPAIVTAIEGDPTDFDAWLDKYGAGCYDCSGLPPLSELGTGEEKIWKPQRILRHKEFRRIKKQRSDLLRGGVTESGATRDSGRPSLPSPSLSVQGACPTAVLGRDGSSTGLVACTAQSASVLSPAAIELLAGIPFRQFVLPRSWKVSKSWRPTTAGFLDLYSGKKGVAHELADLGNVWVITFELDDGLEQDVLSPHNKETIRGLLQSGCILGLGVAIFCSSFSRAVRPPVRSSSEPYGIAGISSAMQEKVLLGNAHAIWVSGLIKLCHELSILFWVENPDGSFLWHLREFRELGSNSVEHVCRLDYCTMGTIGRKRTRFLTNCHLRGQTFWCSRKHTHVALKGWCRQHKCSWTRLAQTYPRRLCRLLAKSLLIDSGLLKQPKVNLSKVSRCEHCRIGEASNPGPRARRVPQRDVSVLEQASLVNAGTVLLGHQVWSAFQRWLSENFSPGAAAGLQKSPEVVGLLVCEFGKFLYATGQSIYLLRQLITHMQRNDPLKRPYLQIAWQLVSKWEMLEPTVHRTPLPYVVYRAMVSLALCLGWKRVAGVLVIAFEAICRPGEVLRAKRCDLLLPSDLVAEDPGRVFLRIQNPKSKRRGIGAIQHAKISDPLIAGFLQGIFGDFESDRPLFCASASTFRKRWNLLLSQLYIPITLGLTPASMRAGGAVKMYRTDEDISKLMWKMRLKNVETLQHYLQEVGAESAFLQLPDRSKAAVVAASALFEVLLLQSHPTGARY